MEDTLKNARTVAGSCEIAIIGLFVAFLMTTTLPARADKDNRQTDSCEVKTVCVVGHRGVAGLKPENTLAGFSLALEMGVDAIELDVLMTADNELAVHHDFNLKPEIARHPGGNWLETRDGTQINQLTVKQLKTFDVGRLKPQTRYALGYPKQIPSDGERIPLLREVIQMIKKTDRDSVQLWIEIKTSPEEPHKTPPPETVAESVLTFLKAESFTQRVKILSFDWRSLIHIQKMAPTIPTVYLTSETKQFKAASFSNPWESTWTAGFDIGKHADSIPQTILAAGGSWWAPKYTQLNAKQVKEAHRLGLSIAVWTPDSKKAIKKMLDMGVDAVITNRPDLLQQILSE
jgi:glycerophosphoryl diester phosphodiesterase